VWLSLLTVAAALLTGCGRDEPIRVYETAATPRPRTMEPPAHWRRVPPGRMDPGDILSKFETGEGRDRVQINVSSPNNDDPLANINRWRNQLGLGPIDEKDLPGQLTALKVDQYEGKYAEMVAPERSPDEKADEAGIPPHLAKRPAVREAIYVAMVPAKGRTWFFRLKGPVAAAEREKATFKAFVENSMKAIALAVREPTSEEAADGK
jgi:hypothetical protein